MEFGLFLEFPRPVDGNHHDAFVQSFRLVQEAEDLGVSSVWLAEYHFNMERVLASPVTIASAIAAKTSTMRIGTAVYCLPLGHPIRVAEEMATLDHISDGRAELGVGRGTFPNVHEGFNVSFEESRSRFDEFLEVVTTAWTQETFSFHGEHFSCDEIDGHAASVPTTPSADNDRGYFCGELPHRRVDGPPADCEPVAGLYAG